MVRCAYCHVEGKVARCPQCKTAIHDSCRSEHGSCVICGYKPEPLKIQMTARQASPLEIFWAEVRSYPELGVGLFMLLVGLGSLCVWYAA